jgi:hypothetical protein
MRTASKGCLLRLSFPRRRCGKHENQILADYTPLELKEISKKLSCGRRVRDLLEQCQN